MNFGTTVVAVLALTAVSAYAHNDADQKIAPGTIHSKSEGGRTEDRAHAEGLGRPGNPNKVSRMIQVVMSDDMKFAPARITVKRGETIRFAVRNAGKIKHEMVIGSMVELKQHAELMRKWPGMVHADANMVTLDPGKTGELIWQFTKVGTFNFACLEPGHFEAGMLGKVSVK